MGKLDFKSTKDIAVPKDIIDQVVGQEEAGNIIKKASLQRRHVLLIGEPGTGKSMLGLALAELLPKEKLMDILAYSNPNDENQPLIRTAPAGKGREEINKMRLQSTAVFKNQNILFIVIAIIISVIPYYLYSKRIFPFDDAVVYAASMITTMVLILGIAMFVNLNKKMNVKLTMPKIVVDNYNKKHAPFLDATGAHAGALLGDVLHDPFQSFFTGQELQVRTENGLKRHKINEMVDLNILENKENILRNGKNNHEAVFLPKDKLFILGETHGSVSPVEVLSCNRYDYDGMIIKLTTSENKEIIVTPEHKIAISKNGETSYAEAKDIKEGDEIVSKTEDIIIDEQDIINTYNARQQDQCRLYRRYVELSATNPTWGYKRIAVALKQPIGKTRWWHAGKHIPVPIQTANWLKERGLLPLRLDNQKLPLIARVLGSTFGDGGIYNNLNAIFLSGKNVQDVQEFNRDLQKIFGNDIMLNTELREGGEYGHSWCMSNTNRNAIRFFLALGAPQGNKTHLELKVPTWISLNGIFEDEFYGSLFGGELGTPIIHKRANRLTNLELGITGKEGLEGNRYEFLSKVAVYLSRRNVICTSVYKRRLNETSTVYRLQIGKKFDNVLYFLMNIKINYCRYKVERIYSALGKWAQLKKNKYEELMLDGYGAEHAMKVLHLTPNSLYLLLNHFGPAEATA